jgi:hypothetical protein
MLSHLLLLRDHLIDEVSGEVLYVYSREREIEKYRRKFSSENTSTSLLPDPKSKSLSTSDSMSKSSPSKDLDDDGAKEAMTFKVKRLGQSAFSSLFGRASATADGVDTTRQRNSKALSDARIHRSVKRMPSLVNGVVVMAAIPSKPADNAKGRWSPCSGSENEQSDAVYPEVSDCASISTGDPHDFEISAEHCKVQEKRNKLNVYMF